MVPELVSRNWCQNCDAKQNVKGGQVIALDLFGEAKGKVRKVLEEMRHLAQ